MTCLIQILALSSDDSCVDLRNNQRFLVQHRVNHECSVRGHNR